MQEPKVITIGYVIGSTVMHINDLPIPIPTPVPVRTYTPTRLISQHHMLLTYWYTDFSYFLYVYVRKKEIWVRALYSHFTPEKSIGTIFKWMSPLDPQTRFGSINRIRSKSLQ